MDSTLIFILFIIPVSILFEVRADEVQDVSLLQEYLRIDTSFPKPNYEAAAEWLATQAKSLQLQFQLIELKSEGNDSLPVAILTWTGTNPTLNSVLLYNHLDTVTVDPKTWTVDPFGGEIIDGKIYGRGVQDMKSMGIEQILAIRNLQSRDFKPIRTIHIAFCPDEERGGHDGMELFMNTPEFKALKIGFVLDEGMHNEFDTLEIYYTERKPLLIKFKLPGASGHGSLLSNNSAGEKLQKVLNSMLNLRHHEALRLKFDKSITLGDVTSVNLNMIEGGIQENVTPPWLSALFDIRVTPHWDLNEFREFLDATCAEAGEGVTYELSLGVNWEQEETTDITVGSWWWNAIQEACNKINLKIVPRIFPAATDGRYLRKIGIPVLGMNTIFKSPNLLHAPDEYLLVEDFNQGIKIYTTIIEHLASSKTNSVPAGSKFSDVGSGRRVDKPKKKEVENGVSKLNQNLMIPIALVIAAIF